MQSNVPGVCVLGVRCVFVHGSRSQASKKNLFINVGSQLPQNNKTKAKAHAHTELPGHCPSIRNAFKF